jgi:hypothetical protein
LTPRVGTHPDPTTRTHSDTDMDRLTVKLPASGKRFVNSISSSYSDQYDPILTNIISKKELQRMVEDLNDRIIENWPCLTCSISSCLCIPCTLGLSLLATSYCTSAAEAAARKVYTDIGVVCVCVYMVYMCIWCIIVSIIVSIIVQTTHLSYSIHSNTPIHIYTYSTCETSP